MSTLMMKSDKDIQKDVMKELDWDPQIDAVEVGVQVKEGLVTLTGNVSTYVKKLAAKRAAHRVVGVLDVVNNLVVEIPDRHKKTDQEISMAVRHAMEWNILVPHAKVHTTVSNGHVTLEGDVDSWADKMEAECTIERLAGVKCVTNRIEIRPTKHVSAEAIHQAIEEALERQTHREADRIQVKVANGLVTLRGTVRSWTEKNAVRNVAIYTQGVERVDDRLVVIDSSL